MASISKLAKLTTIDLKKVYKELLPVSAKWYDLGLELDLSSDTLDNIKSTFGENNDRLRECVKIFLKQVSPVPTWEVIVKALAEPHVGYSHLAQELADKFVKNEDKTKLTHTKEQSMIKDLQELVKKQSEYMSRILAMQNLGDKLSVVSFQSPEDYEVSKRATLTVTNKGLVYDWKGCGIRLTVPDGALPDDMNDVKLQVKVTLSGRYNSISENVEFASPVYWIEPIPPIKFVKPILVEIQHCADLQGSSSASDLSFVVTKHPIDSTDAHHSFDMLPGGQFTRHTCYGKILLQSFSGLAIALPKGGRRRYIGQLWYTDSETLSVLQDQEEWTVRFTIIMDLDILKSAVEARFVGYIEGMAVAVQFDGSQIMLDIPSSGKTAEDEWVLYPIYPPVITMADMDIFNSPSGKLVPECTLKCVRPIRRRIVRPYVDVIEYENFMFEQQHRRVARPNFKFVVDMIGACAPNDYLIIDISNPRGLVHVAHKQMTQKLFVSSLTYKALTPSCCEILYVIMDSSDPEVRSGLYAGSRYRQLIYANREHKHGGELIDGPSQNLTFLSDEVELDLPVSANGWEISPLNYPSLQARNIRSSMIHMIAKYTRKCQKNVPPPLEAVIFIAGAAAPQNYIKIFYDYSVMVHKEKRKRPKPSSIYQDLNGDDSDVESNNSVNILEQDTQNFPPGVAVAGNEQDTEEQTEGKLQVDEKHVNPVALDDVSTAAIHAWHSFVPKTSTTKKKPRSLEASFQTRQTVTTRSSMSRNSVDTQSFSSLM